MGEKNMLKKIKHQNNKKLIAILICLFLAITSFCIYISFIEDEEKKEKPINYNDLIATNSDKKNMYVSIEIADIPYQIAQREVNYTYIKYYILYDKSNDMYVAKLTDETYKKIKTAYEKDKTNFSYTLTGYIYNTPSDLKKLIIDEFNKNTSNKITKDNYSNYFGSTYFDDTYTKFTTGIAISLIIVFLSIASAIAIFINWLICAINTKKTLSKIDYDEVERELAKTSMKEYKKIGLYLTDKYLVSLSLGLHIYNYNDISWIYIENTSTRFGNKVFLNIFMKNKKKFKTKKVDSLQEEMLETLQEISTKNANILLGYTYENMTNYNKSN